MALIKKITRIPIKDVWKYEDRNLTPWLCENIDVLSDAIGIQLSNPERELSTGNFNVDIKAEDPKGNIVVIENQYGNSNHDHLGKLITYLSSLNAQIAIWIVENAKQEHINAVTWFNEGDNNCDFYLLQIEAIKIEDSPYAPLITKIVGPSEESKIIGEINKDYSERHTLRFQFWEKLLEKAKNKHKLFSTISPTHYNWIGASSGVRGINYTYWLTKDAISLKIYIDRGKDSDEENIRLFNELLQHRDEIEEKFGERIEWDELKQFRVCAIKKELKVGGWKTDSNKWDDIQEVAIDKMKKLEEATRPYILKLNV